MDELSCINHGDGLPSQVESSEPLLADNESVGTERSVDKFFDVLNGPNGAEVCATIRAIAWPAVIIVSVWAVHDIIRLRAAA